MFVAALTVSGMSRVLCLVPLHPLAERCHDLADPIERQAGSLHCLPLTESQQEPFKYAAFVPAYHDFAWVPFVCFVNWQPDRRANAEPGCRYPAFAADPPFPVAEQTTPVDAARVPPDLGMWLFP